MKFDLFAGAADPRVVRRLNAVIVLLILLVVAIPGSVWASHQFTDVPDDHTHHATIAAAKNAGITGGCNQTGTLYCPSDPVNRGQMASFLHRGLGRTGYETATTPIPLNGEPVTVNSLTITAPGVTGGGTQFVKVDADYNLRQAAASGCPCEVTFWLRESVGNWLSADRAESVSNTSVSDEATGAVSFVIPVPSGATRTFELRAVFMGGTGMTPPSLDAETTMTAITAPYGPTGGSTL